MASKKDFNATAEVLNANLAPLSIVLDFADMFKEDNPRFDRGRFVFASTVKLRESFESDLRMVLKEVER